MKHGLRLPAKSQPGFYAGRGAGELSQCGGYPCRRDVSSMELDSQAQRWVLRSSQEPGETHTDVQTLWGGELLCHCPSTG